MIQWYAYSRHSTVSKKRISPSHWWRGIVGNNWTAAKPTIPCPLLCSKKCPANDRMLVSRHSTVSKKRISPKHCWRGIPPAGGQAVGNNWTAATNDSVSAPLIIKMSGERQNVGFPTFYRQHEEVDFKSIVPGVYHAEGGTLSVEPFLSNQHLPRENLQTIIDLQ